MNNYETIEKYLSQDFSESTKRYYKSMLTKFVDHLHDIDKSLETFDETDVQTYYKSKLKDNTWTSREGISTFLTVLKTFCKWYQRQLNRELIGMTGKKLITMQKRIVALDEIIYLKKPKVVQRMKTDAPVTIRDLEKIFKLMLNNRKDPSHYTFKRMWTLCALGCRPGEMSKLKPSMISLDEDKIEVDTEKTHVIRINFYSGITKKIMEEYLDDNHIFNISEGNIWRCVSLYSKPFGKKIYPKLGRNAFITHMDGRVSDNEKLKKKYGVPKLGEEFTKVMVGHGITDMTSMYKRYPLPLIKDVMINYHYLNDLGRKLERLL